MSTNHREYGYPKRSEALPPFTTTGSAPSQPGKAARAALVRSESTQPPSRDEW
jgi:hypothetical protein